MTEPIALTKNEVKVFKILQALQMETPIWARLLIHSHILDFALPDAKVGFAIGEDIGNRHHLESEGWRIIHISDEDCDDDSKLRMKINKGTDGLSWFDGPGF